MTCGVKEDRDGAGLLPPLIPDFLEDKLGGLGWGREALLPLPEAERSQREEHIPELRAPHPCIPCSPAHVMTHTLWQPSHRSLPFTPGDLCLCIHSCCSHLTKNPGRKDRCITGEPAGWWGAELRSPRICTAAMSPSSLVSAPPPFGEAPFAQWQVRYH